MIPLTVWMNMPSFYQDDLFAALVATGEVELQVIFARPLSAERRALGWQVDGTRYQARQLDSAQPLRDAARLAWQQRARLHLVNGIWAEPAFAAALGALALAGSRFAIYAEAPDPRPRRAAALQAAKRAFGAGVARRARGLLAVSHFASDFYGALGFRRAQLYPFGYFQAAPASVPLPAPPTSPNLVFVGQLVERKGVDLLLAALPPLAARFPTLRLTLIGDGAARPTLEAQVAALGLGENVTFAGVLPSSTIRERIRGATALVLPSRWDGWGLVVNEALSVGVPAIVSDGCGVADVVAAGAHGYHFRNGDVEALRHALEAILGQSRAEQEKMRAAAAAQGATLATDHAAPYLVACLRHMLDNQAGPHPIAPWSHHTPTFSPPAPKAVALQQA